VVIRYHIFKLKLSKYDFGCGFHSTDIAGGAYSTPRLLARFKGAASKEMKGAAERKGRDGKRGEEAGGREGGSGSLASSILL